VEPSQGGTQGLGFSLSNFKKEVPFRGKGITRVFLGFTAFQLEFWGLEGFTQGLILFKRTNSFFGKFPLWKFPLFFFQNQRA